LKGDNPVRGERIYTFKDDDGDQLKITTAPGLEGVLLAISDRNTLDSETTVRVTENDIDTLVDTIMRLSGRDLLVKALPEVGNYRETHRLPGGQSISWNSDDERMVVYNTGAAGVVHVSPSNALELALWLIALSRKAISAPTDEEVQMILSEMNATLPPDTAIAVATHLATVYRFEKKLP
jgi:hypothetical protein